MSAGKTHWQPRKPWYWVATRGSNNFFHGTKKRKNTAESTQQETLERSGEWSTINFITTWFFNPLDSFWRKRGGRPEYSEMGAGTIANYIDACIYFTKKSFKTIFHRKRGSHSPLGRPPKFPHVEGWGAWKVSLFIVLGSNYFCWNFIFRSPLSPSSIMILFKSSMIQVKTQQNS